MIMYGHMVNGIVFLQYINSSLNVSITQSKIIIIAVLCAGKTPVSGLACLNLIISVLWSHALLLGGAEINLRRHSLFLLRIISRIICRCHLEEVVWFPICLSCDDA